jgi:hypothetical protein
MIQGYEKEQKNKIWPEKWYSTSILGSWISQWLGMQHDITKQTWHIMGFI